MIKKITISIALLLSSLLFLATCTKEEIQTSNKNSISHLKESSNLLIDTTYRGLYVGSFNTILGTSSEDTLLNWASRQGFNTLSLYSLSTIFSSSTSTSRLPIFIKKAKSRNFRVIGICGGTSSFQTLHNWNVSRADLQERFDGYNLELEWWNGASTFSNYSTILRGMRTSVDRTTPKPSMEVYIGWFTSGSEAAQADTLVKYCDRILIHDYRTSPSFSYTKTRLEWIGGRGFSRGKKVQMIPIFSAEKISFGASNDFMGNYYWINGLNKSFETGFLDYRGQWLNWLNSPPITPNSLPKYWYTITGYQVFQYRYAKIARP